MKNEMQISLEGTVLSLQQTLNLFNREELNKESFDSGWTAGQVTDHVLKSQLLVTGLLYGKTKLTDRDPLEKAETIKEIFLDFTIKMKSPEVILPSNTMLEKVEILNRIGNLELKAIEAIKTLDLSVTCIEFSLPGIGEMTRAEWIYFIIYHTQRHIHQLKNISQKLHAQTPSVN